MQNFKHSGIIAKCSYKYLYFIVFAAILTGVEFLMMFYKR
jgi:hypothetical protein